MSDYSVARNFCSTRRTVRTPWSQKFLAPCIHLNLTQDLDFHTPRQDLGGHFRDPAESSEFKEYIHQLLVKNYTEVKKIYHEIKDSLLQENQELRRDCFTKKFLVLSSIHTTDPPPLKRIKITLTKNIQKYLTCLSFPFLSFSSSY